MKVINATLSDVFKRFLECLKGERNITTEKEMLEFKSSYFAMHLLVPTDSFMKHVENMGGLDEVKFDYDKRHALARIFLVDDRLIEAKIYDIEYKNYMENKTL